MKNLFTQTLKKENRDRPPVWFMRQAGRYHSHYQALRAKYSFMDLCKKPEIACEVTMGPIDDFNFDAAILFSDLLFPLEAMGMGLRYEPGPKLDWHLKSKADLSKLKGGVELASFMGFQAEAVKLIRKKLDPSKGLLGFVGGPLTLFCYAVEGSHQGGLRESQVALKDGRFAGFCDKLIDMLAENMALQAQAGVDTVAVMDTCAGDFSVEDYREFIVPVTKKLFDKFKAKCPNTPITYYSKGTGPAHWDAIADAGHSAIGIDWNHDMAEVLLKYGKRFAVQGNVDPNWILNFDAPTLEKKLREVFLKVKSIPAEYRQGWICGLGHGVIQKTPEENVKLFIKLQHEIFGS